MILIHWLLTVMMFGAFVSSLALRNSPDHQDPHYVEVGRNLIIGAWFMMGCLSAYTLATRGQLETHPAALVAIGLMSLGAILSCLGRLLQEELAATRVKCPGERSAPTANEG